MNGKNQRLELAKRLTALQERVADVTSYGSAALDNLTNSNLSLDQQKDLCDLIDNMFVYAARLESLAIERERETK